MRLVKQTTLVLQERGLERIYEIDLCEVGAGRYVVNFRSGTRGKPLMDGSTVAPVSLDEAERVFKKMVDGKIAQGYREPGAPAPRAPEPIQASPGARGREPGSADGRKKRILERLTKSGPLSWPLERVIWRAGELGLREAEAPLLRLLPSLPTTSPAPGTPAKGRDTTIRTYSVLWALGRCGGELSLEPLRRVYADEGAAGHLRRIATEAWMRLASPEACAELRAGALSSLPQSLLSAHATGDRGAFQEALGKHIESDENAFAAMDLLYLIDDPVVRPGFLHHLARAPFAEPTFYWLRHIFKAAEYRHDPEVFGLFAHRFERTPSKDQGARKVYSKGTREFLRRRTWRTLRRLGELGDPDYVRMAVGVLLAFTDGDAVPVRASYSYQAKRQIEWGPFAPYRVFNHILYTGSPRFELRRNRPSWNVRQGRRLADPAPPSREEAFPSLWDGRPAGLMHLLAESSCAPVHEFAARALEGRHDFTDRREDEDVILVMGKPYEPTARLGFLLASRRILAGNRRVGLILAAASSVHSPARAKAFEWIEERRAELLEDTAFLCDLVTSTHEDARLFARRMLSAAALPEERATALIGRIVARLLVLGASGAAIAEDATRTITSAMGAHLRSVSPEVIMDLLKHPLPGVQELGAELLSRHDSRTGLIPVHVILAVVRSPFKGVRAVGLRLLSELGDDALTLNFKLLVYLACDENEDLRAASRPLLRRVASAHPEIAKGVVTGIADTLLRRKLGDVAANHALAVLREDFAHLLHVLGDDHVWRLLQSGSSQAQELGGLLLGRIDASALELDQIIRLASHEILAVRVAARTMFERSLPRVHADLAEAVRVLDSRWPDTRAWAFQLFRGFSPDMFTADVLVSVADSTKADVQAFGRELLQRSFRDEDGPTLLLRLSEHPAPAVQLFSTNYLERFASGNLGRIQALVPYFSSVLSRINGGRIARARVFAFLQREGELNRESARVIAEILDSISRTISLESRARALEAMCAIHRAHPGVTLPLVFTEPRLRTRDPSHVHARLQTREDGAG